MKKRFLLFISFVGISMTLSGCMSFIPGYSSEDKAIITGYTADLLLSHSKGYESRLLSEEDKEAAIEEEIAAREEVKKQIEEEEKRKQEQIEASKPDEEIVVKEPEKVVTAEDLNSLLGLDGFSLDYLGYDLKSSYPDSGEEELIFAMNPTEGKQFLVLKYNLANISGADASINMLDHKANYFITVNGGSKKPILTTFLPDDFCFFEGTLPVESGIQLAMVFEVPDDLNVESLVLTVQASGMEKPENITLE